jgi:hypothetical protein
MPDAVIKITACAIRGSDLHLLDVDHRPWKAVIFSAMLKLRVWTGANATDRAELCS